MVEQFKGGFRAGGFIGGVSVLEGRPHQDQVKAGAPFENLGPVGVAEVRVGPHRVRAVRQAEKLQPGVGGGRGLRDVDGAVEAGAEKLPEFLWQCGTPTPG